MQYIFVDARVAFDYMQLIGVGMPRGIEPGFFVEPYSIYNQCVAFPMANRVPQVGQIQLVALRMRASVR